MDIIIATVLLVSDCSGAQFIHCQFTIALRRCRLLPALSRLSNAWLEQLPAGNITVIFGTQFNAES